MNGVLGRVNPLVLVAVGLLALIASLGVRSLTSAVITTCVYVLAGLLMLPARSGRPIRFATVLLASVSVAYSTWLLGGGHLDVAATAGLRIAVLALPGIAVAPLIEPMALADQLGQRLRLPHRFVVSFAAALQRFEQLGQTWQHLSRARRSRGFGPGRGPVSRTRHASSVTFGLLVTTMREATSASIAMDARGFAHAHRRTWAEPAPWTRTDTTVLLLGALVATVPYVAEALIS
ncbi:energy-coupling factor transporter transmembrane component T [Saccharopolyspora sp. WRP15-2]|uniref:Energy-coupling factor transporter transmembrane component T n=1 Tax=Saccharopolyspora oryzae TaxID=2997343 RepID=A0ABT4V7F3_9PSEU|nr:energy-coupling factor transporter transmembrane component T [Saccharopolyspora oryzae]MDA3629890.1 energy-coupling factor transporter transmembrane component T [Saccharopolyspora oryzae]